jgi:hypothetical protein
MRAHRHRDGHSWSSTSWTGVVRKPPHPMCIPSSCLLVGGHHRAVNCVRRIGIASACQRMLRFAGSGVVEPLLLRPLRPRSTGFPFRTPRTRRRSPTSWPRRAAQPVVRGSGGSRPAWPSYCRYGEASRRRGARSSPPRPGHDDRPNESRPDCWIVAAGAVWVRLPS